jgi:hypothetical protein
MRHFSLHELNEVNKSVFLHWPCLSREDYSFLDLATKRNARFLWSLACAAAT